MLTLEAESSVTDLLERWRQGESRALGDVMPLVYGDLRRIAARLLAGERVGHTLQTRDLLHETFLRLREQERATWRDREHFFSVSARLMRWILVDHARRRQRRKRGGDLTRESLANPTDTGTDARLDLVALDDALADLARLDPRLVEVVDLRFFAGLDHDEIAATLGVSRATARRRWELARAWLFRRLKDGAAHAR